MNSIQWEQLREFCRDHIAFEGLRQYVEQSLAQDQAVERAIDRIRQSLDLEGVCQVAVQEIQFLLQADRVQLLRLSPQGRSPQTELMAEEIKLDLELAIASNSQPLDPPLSLENSASQTLEVTHWQVPLEVDHQLWGWLGIQSRLNRESQPEKRRVVARITEQLVVAIQQAELLRKTREQVNQRKALAKVIAQIREALDLQQIFNETVKEVRVLLKADRVAVFQFFPSSNYNSGEFIAEDVSPVYPSALAMKVHDHCFGEQFAPQYQQGRMSAIEDIYQAELKDCHVQILAAFQVRSNVVVPLLQGETLWGLLCIHQCEHSRKWESEEIDFINQIAQNLDVALQQVEYLEKVRTTSRQLAIASERQKSAEQQKTLAETIDKIRQSSEINSIFKTTTESVRLLLNADRVAVYRFNPDWSGCFVAESVAEGWNRLIGNLNLIKDTYLQATQGGRYCHNQSLAVEDIYTAGHEECHVELLEQFQARAYIIAPILQGKNLWGLLAAYQNSQPRQWQEDEVQLLAQIGTQFGIALQQAELLAQTQRQAQELAKDLKQTQTQLVQSEKMSSLGQLVAGVAHEINNPVNFIYGNLIHANEYIQDLLELVKLYQQECSQFPPRVEEKIEEIDLEFLMEDLPKILSSMQLGADRIRQLVLSLRNFSRLDESDMKPVDIHQGIDSTLLILQHRFKAKPEHPLIEIVREYGKLPKIECYAAQLNQVFMNLLSNSVDALEEANQNGGVTHPVIRIKTAQVDPDWISIQIKDNGCGMPEGVRSQIFDPFFTTKPVGKGTGLGLSISYQIITEKHRGKILCHSQPNQGTEFYIEIPVKQF